MSNVLLQLPFLLKIEAILINMMYIAFDGEQ